MDQTTIQKLAAATAAFYERHAGSFAASRTQSWHGWQQLIAGIQAAVQRKPVHFLDLGCGNGRFLTFLEREVVMHEKTTAFTYTGIDSSAALLKEADAVQTTHAATFQQRDILTELLAGTFFTTFHDFHASYISVYGVMHHIPSQELRRQLLSDLAQIISPDGTCVISFWQFEQFLTKESCLANPTQLALSESDLEPGDYLLGWHGDVTAPRYCHNFSDSEALELARATGWNVVSHFHADGKEDKANLYLVLTPQQR